ncbi:MAG: F0F1 ATP synthase subunit A [Chlorobi bacterium]|nr:F0F1 ATP synthase subunit A [Chlorobiota bacterium]
MKFKTKTINLFALIALLFLFLLSFQSFAEEHNQKEHQEATEGKFDAGSFIFEHIGDGHDWHILTVNGHHISIPLPIILYSENSGFHVFWSSKLAHGDSYKGFWLDHEKGKIVEDVNGQEYLPWDFSITKNVMAIFISMALLFWIFISIGKSYKKNVGKAPKGMQSLLEPIVLFIRDDLAKEAIGEKKYERYLPFLLTIFFFILINNLLGLIPIFPGGANVTGNIAVTMVLALFTFTITTFSGNKNYWKHIFNAPGVPWWLKIPIPLMPIIEIIGMFTKPFVLMVRLFANILAGHIIAMGFFSLIFIFGAMHMIAGYGISVVSVAFAIFMTFLELLVAFIQAYVFTLLSALYFGMATEEHH